MVRPTLLTVISLSLFFLFFLWEHLFKELRQLSFSLKIHPQTAGTIWNKILFQRNKNPQNLVHGKKKKALRGRGSAVSLEFLRELPGDLCFTVPALAAELSLSRDTRGVPGSS